MCREADIRLEGQKPSPRFMNPNVHYPANLLYPKPDESNRSVPLSSFHISLYRALFFFRFVQNLFVFLSAILKCKRSRYTEL